MRPLSAALAAVLTAGSLQAQIDINEVYCHHFGPDDQEYVELVAPTNTSLDNHMIVIIDGDQPVNGFLDRAWDLTGHTFPNDGGGRGFIVVGDSAVANLDVDVGATNAIEDGTCTVMLAFVGNPAAVQAIVGTHVDTNGDNLVDIGTIAGTTFQIIALVGLVDSGYPLDTLYNGAQPIGPGYNGIGIPSGIFREGDAPNPWCLDVFLDPDDVANAAQPRSPGAANTALCQAEPGTASCFGVGCPCGNDDPTAGCANSSGGGALLSGTGSTSVAADNLVLDATGLPTNVQGLYYMGNTVVSNHFFDGFQCALGTTFRYLTSIQNSGATGTMSYTGCVADSSPLITAGSTWYFHCWFRDPISGPCATGANLTSLYGVTFTP